MTNFGSACSPPLTIARAPYETRAFKVLTEYRVVFEALELIKRAEVRVAVGQVNNQPNHNLVILQVVEKRATNCLAREVSQRPANRVNNLPRNVFCRVDVPEFLQANCVMLGPGIFAQVELTH